MMAEVKELNQAALPSSAALSYLGDAVHSLYVRRLVLESGYTKSADLHAEGQKYVTAAAQAAAFDRIYDHLTEEEKDVARRAHNSRHLQRPKHMTVAEYRKATGFEALLGMLYYRGDEQRIATLMAISLMQKL